MSKRADRLIRWWVPRLAEVFIRALGATLRVSIRDEGGYLRNQTPCVAVFWHNRLLMMPWMYGKMGIRLPLSVMISRSKDGQIITEVAARFGVGALRGSSSRGATEAVREGAQALQRKGLVGITPDGPRGPRYTIKPGMAHLARVAGVPVVPVTVHYGWKWQAKSWDGFQIPLPFSRAEWVVAAPISPQTSDLETQVKAALGE